MWVNQLQGEKHGDGKQDENQGRQPSLSCLYPHIAIYPKSLSDHPRQLVQDLRQVSAGLLLDHQSRDKETHVDNRNTLGHVQQRIPEREPKILFLKSRTELACDRFRRVLGNHLETGRESM